MYGFGDTRCLIDALKKLTHLSELKDRHEHTRQIVAAAVEAAGLGDVIDARLGDAHELAKTLPGPFDFVFSDADKSWYTQYFIDIAPKMVPGGCYTSHNIDMRGMGKYIEHLERRPDFETTIERNRTTGIAVTCRTR